MTKKISFHQCVAGIGMKHITFYHEPDVLESRGTPIMRIVLLDADGAEVAEMMLGAKDIARLGAWLRGVSLREAAG